MAHLTADGAFFVQTKRDHRKGCPCDDCVTDRVLFGHPDRDGFDDDVRQYRAWLTQLIDWAELQADLEATRLPRPTPRLLAIEREHPDLSWLVWLPPEERKVYAQWLPSLKKRYPEVGEDQWLRLFPNQRD